MAKYSVFQMFDEAEKADCLKRGISPGLVDLATKNHCLTGLLGLKRDFNMLPDEKILETLGLVCSMRKIQVYERHLAEAYAEHLQSEGTPQIKAFLAAGEDVNKDGTLAEKAYFVPQLFGNVQQLLLDLLDCLLSPRESDRVGIPHLRAAFFLACQICPESERMHPVIRLINESCPHLNVPLVETLPQVKHAYDNFAQKLEIAK